MDIFANLKDFQGRRMAIIKATTRLQNQASALARQRLGWRVDLPEAERNKINRKAQALVKALQTGGEIPAEQMAVAEIVVGFASACRDASLPLNDERDRVQKVMVDLVQSLPAWPWVKAVKGFGPINFAALIGETGDLFNFANPAKLWSYCCLGVVDGKQQVEASHRKKSVTWLLGDCLIKGNKDGYRTIYDERKAYESERPETKNKMHAHRKAQRYMVKRVLRDLWTEWTQAA